jgi:hypothetical protein
MGNFYRLYLDSVKPVRWAVDTGDPLSSKHFEIVILSSPGSTNSDPEPGRIPKVWLEFYDAELREEEGIGYIED